MRSVFRSANIKRRLCVVLMLSMLCSLLCVNTVAASEQTWTTTASGTCGKNNTALATWKLLQTTNPQIINNVQDYERLVISGSGEMEDYYQTSSGSTNAPWQEMAWDTNSIVIEEGVTHIGNNAFLCASYATCYVSLPQSLHSIGSYAFCGAMKYVTELVVPENVTYIGAYAFYNNNFTNVEIMGDVTVLHEGVFGYCKSLKTVTIPKSVTSIADYAFDSCTALTDIYYEGTRAEWEEISIGAGNTYLLNATVHFPTVNVESVSLDKTTKTLFAGSSFTLTATILPENADNKMISWKSSDSTVATVNNGVVTAVAPGTAQITVTTADGNKTAFCTVAVQASTVAVTGISLNKTELEIRVGDTETLTATIQPANATNQYLTWSTSNANVATVVNGKITPVSEGSATITVTTVDGGLTATCNVTVKGANVPISGIVLNKTTLRLWTGDEETLQATISPTNASNKNITWVSSNTNVATIDDEGTIVAKSKGQTTITATTDDGNQAATCVVTVHYGAAVDEFEIWKTNYGTQYETSDQTYLRVHKIDVSWTPIHYRYSNTEDYDMYSLVDFVVTSEDGKIYNFCCQPYYNNSYNYGDNQLKQYLPAGKTYTIAATLRVGYTEGYYFVEKASYESNTITITLPSCTYYKTSFGAEYLAKAATCGSPAKYYANCQYCGVNHDKLISHGDTNPENHAYGKWTSIDETYHSRACECGSATETGEHSYVDGICEYCSAEKPEKYKINSISVRDNDGAILSEIPSRSCLATVSITNLSTEGNTLVFLAAYTSTGQYQGMMWVSVEDLPVGATIKVTLPVDNSDGKIANLKAFTVASFSNLTPLGEAVSFLQ